MGTGAGFPGVVISIFDLENNFHVKLYEKSPIKRKFLNDLKEKLSLNVEILKNINDHRVEADILVARAFRKLPVILGISREMAKKPRKIIILKGKNAKKEINSISLDQKYSYRLEHSITDDESKIIIFNRK